MHRPGDGVSWQRGFVLVWLCLSLTTLMAAVAFAIELNNLSRVGTQAQKAADAAALAGAVFLPGDPTNQSDTMAQEVAAKNGFTNGVDGVTVATARGVRPNQLVVTITKNSRNLMGGVFAPGMKVITRKATAEYERATRLGSPINQLGNDPETAAAPGSPTYPNVWVNAFGPASQKGKGDGILGGSCSQTNPTPDNCVSGTSADYDPAGYFLSVDVPDNPGSQPLNVQVFDPAFVHVGDNCGDNSDPGDGYPTSNLSGAAGLAANFNPMMSGDPVAPNVRYNASATSLYCTGDQYYTEGTIPTYTTYILRGPDQTPSDPSDNPKLCSIEFGGRNEDIRAALLRTATVAGEPDLFVRYFRQWYPMCSSGIANAQPGTYYLQVTTARKGDDTAAPIGAGANRLAVRAALGSSYSAAQGLSVSGETRLSIYANRADTSAWFYLARLLPGGQDRALNLRLFDIGDAAAAGSLQILPPPEATVNGLPMVGFQDCTWTQPPGNSTGPPWGTMIDTGGDCTITGVHSSTFDRQWIEFRIPVPAAYDCDDTGGGCWTRIQFSFPTNVNDTTTWTAGVEDPVRLVS